MRRYLESTVKADLGQKMVFVGGPRQVGKTTLATQIAGGRSGYLNWDIPKDRQSILSRSLPDTELWVFDELHKYRRWRNYLKGIYDEYHPLRRILVTGSARLDLYRFGGDSLQGRYFYHRLHPLSFGELDSDSQQTLEQLMELGGFPEPFLSGSKRQARRWALAYRDRLLRDDVATVENVRDLGTMEQLLLALPQRVGSPLSVNSLREDLQLNHQTVSRWLEIFERMYAIFRLIPFGAPKLRAVKKERKHYHYDWSLLEESGAKFENMVASHLLKWTHYEYDHNGRVLELRYFRDHDRREVDFVLVEKKQPILLVESKTKSGDAAPALRYLHERFPKAEAVQVHLEDSPPRVQHGIQLQPARTFLKRFP